MANFEEKYTFKVEWLDTAAALKRQYLLTYFITGRDANEVELYDLKNRRVFLKRVAFPSIARADLFIGAKLNIYARQMTVVEFGDAVTERAFAASQAPGFGLVPPAQVKRLGDILAAANAAGLQVGRLKMVQLSPEDATALGDRNYAAGPTVAVQLVGSNAFTKWQTIADTYSCVTAASSEETDGFLECFFGSRALPSAAATTAKCTNCSCMIIKPHAVAAGSLGPALKDIAAAGFEISAMEMFDIDMITAEEFLEVYKGVVPEFHEMAVELSSGRFVAIEVRGDDIVNRARTLAGPRPVDIAQRILPDRLRAKYGVSLVQNGIHATDLEEDGVLECEFFFRILQKPIA